MDVFSNLMVIGECLLDKRRTRAFQRAILKVVQPDMTTLDVGTGSGILSMIAARAGAKHVIAVDIAPDIVRFAQANIKANGLERKIQVIKADAKTISLPSDISMISMELMDTWLVAEQQGPVLNYLHKRKIITEKTILVPYRYQCEAMLAYYNFSFYGFTMSFVIQARNFEATNKISQKLSPKTVAIDIDFRKPFSTAVNQTFSIPITKTGQCNALVLTAKTFLAPGVTLGSTSDMNMPVIVPLPKRNVKKGQKIIIRTIFSMGEGFQKFQLDYAN